MDITTEIKKRDGATYADLRINASQLSEQYGVSWLVPEQIAREVAARIAVPSVQWTEFDYDHKKETGPEAGVLVWIVEEFYEGGVTIGYFDGVTMRTWAGSDDCFVLRWAPISFPPDPHAS